MEVLIFSLQSKKIKIFRTNQYGYPINTPDDDVNFFFFFFFFFFVTSPDGKEVIFISNCRLVWRKIFIQCLFWMLRKKKPLALFKGAIVPARWKKLPDDI